MRKSGIELAEGLCLFRSNARGESGSMLSLFGLSKDSGKGTPAEPVDIKWSRSPKGRFHKLMFLDTMAEGLQGTPGVYIIWHGGAKPTWLAVGSTKDLAETLEIKIDDPEIESYYDRVGVYVSWSPVKMEYHKGIVSYLAQLTKPEIECLETVLSDEEEPIAVFLPGQEKDKTKKSGA